MISAKRSSLAICLLFIFTVILTSCDKSNKPSTQPTNDEPSTTITTRSDHNPRLFITSIIAYINKYRIVRNQHFQPMISDNSIMIFTIINGILIV